MTPREKAQHGLILMKEAIVDLLSMKPDGFRNIDIATELDIHSDYKGTQKDYLSWSILGLLLKEERVIRKGNRYALKSLD